MNKLRLRMVCKPIIPALLLMGLPMASVNAEPTDDRPLGRWAIAIHGGAGSLSPEMNREQRDNIRRTDVISEPVR